MAQRRQGPKSFRRVPSDPTAVVSHARLGATLRSCAESARAFGAHHRWRPDLAADSAENWRAAANDMAARTLCEADVQAVTLMHSGLEHAAAVGQLLSAGRTFLPHTVARTASEHLLRAQHLIDPTATPDERRRRRLNEWAYAAIESDYRRQGLISSALNTAEWVDPDEPLDMGKSKEELLAEISERATAIGEILLAEGKHAKLPRVEGTEGRLSTMRLAELYTAGEASGIPSFTMRGHSAATHGTEIGILGHFADDSPEDPSLGGVIVPQPETLDVATTAFSLLGVLLTCINATDAMRQRFNWPAAAAIDRSYEKAQSKAIEAWSAAINQP